MWRWVWWAALWCATAVAGGGYDVDPTAAMREPSERLVHEPPEGLVLCRSCGAEVAHASHLFDPPLAPGEVEELDLHHDGAPRVWRFKNPLNVPFNVFAVRHADLMVARDRPEAAGTFFQDYEWQVATCPVCGAHLGWRYVLSPAAAASAGCVHQEASTPRRAQPDEAGQFTLEWALQALEGVCLAKDDVAGAAYRWCFDGALEMIVGGETLQLGTRSSEAQAKRLAELEDGAMPEVKLGARTRKYYPLRLEGSMPCEGGTLAVEVMLMCCDSFRLSPDDIEMMHKSHLRLESSYRAVKCEHRAVVCVPKLCAVEPFNIIPQPAFGRQQAADERSPQDDGRSPHDEERSPQESKCPVRSFFGIIWDNVLLDTAQEAQWIQAIALQLNPS